MPHQLTQQRMTLSDLEWSFYASRHIAAVAELLVIKSCTITDYCCRKDLLNFAVEPTQKDRLAAILEFYVKQIVGNC